MPNTQGINQWHTKTKAKNHVDVQMMMMMMMMILRPKAGLLAFTPGDMSV